LSAILRSRPSAGLAAVILIAGGDPAAAHLVTTGLGPFYDGMLHQAASLPDMLAVAALALLAGSAGARQARTVVLTLPIAWVAAGAIVLLLPIHGDKTWLEVAALIGLGGALAAAYAPSPHVAAGLAIAVAFLSAIPDAASADAALASGLAGLAGAALVLFVFSTLVAALAFSLEPAWTRIAVRVVGSWIAAIGLLLLGWTLRGAMTGAA
jgi:hypothetical protein